MTAYHIQTFLAGPALWFSLIFFFGGLGAKTARLFLLSRKKDNIVYNHMSMPWALKSIIPWLFPMGSVSLRSQPIFSIAIFIFHIALIGVPLFLDAHNLLWEDALGFSMKPIPDTLADILSISLIFCGLFLMARRIIRPETRILTRPQDHLLIVLTCLPFLTGIIAYHQFLSYETVIILHILSGEILLIMIPFTKLSHMVFFFFSRAFIGFEMGTRRGARVW